MRNLIPILLAVVVLSSGCCSEGYNCTSDGCYADDNNPQYQTLEDCRSVCDEIIPKPGSCGVPVLHEGYLYSTVQIGSQCWFSENCRYLPNVSTSSSQSSTAPYYYVYDYEGTDVAAAKATKNYFTYGVLYNWPAVMTAGICPSGWHIPTDPEWQTMEISLGMSESEAASDGWRGSPVGDYMKSSGWGSGGNGSNSSGFTGLRGGYVFGSFVFKGFSSYWWSASASGSDSWTRKLDSHDDVTRTDLNRDYGFSARCVKDVTTEDDNYENANFYFNIATNNESDWQYKVDNYTKCLKINPDDTHAYNNRGAAYVELGNYKEAIADYTKCLKINPDYYNACLNRGVAYAELGNYKEAIADYTRAIRIDPDDAHAYNNRGNAYLKLGNYEDAIDEFTRAITIDPDYAYAYYNRGRAYRDLGNYKEALADYTRAIRIDPDLRYAYLDRGNAYAELGNYKEAIADYTRAIRIDPVHAYAYNNRGNAYHALGNYKEAIADYNRGITIGPDDARAYNNRGNSKWYLKLDYCSDYKRACGLGECGNYNSYCK